MKVKIVPVDIPLPLFKHCYAVKVRFHWWARWRYVTDFRTHVPRLFASMNEVDDFLDSNGFKRVK